MPVNMPFAKPNRKDSSQKVVIHFNFILSPSYHGSTLLSILLNNHTGISCLGSSFPPRRFDTLCSCGQHVSQCRFWREIQKRLNSQQFSDCDLMLPLIPRFVPGRPSVNRKINKIFWALSSAFGPRIWMLAYHVRKEYLDAHVGYARAVCNIHGTSTGVVSLNGLSHVIALKSMLGNKTEIKAIHLSRDPRGFFNSCKKYLNPITPERAAEWWTQFHDKMHRFQGSIFNEVFFLRYEDLCSNPAKYMKEIFSFLRVDNQDVCLYPPNPDKFHVTGNKMKNSFDGTIKLDESWKNLLPQQIQKTLLYLTQPISERYKYALDS